MKNDNNAYKRNASIKKIKYTEIFKNINMYITLLSKYLNKD